MVNSLEMQAGSRIQGIVAGSVDPVSQVRGFRYFRGGHPMPNQESIRAAEAMLKSLSAQNASSLVIFLLSGGGSSIAEKPIDNEISLDDLIATYRVLVHSGRAHRGDQRDSQASLCDQGRKAGAGRFPAQQVRCWSRTSPTRLPMRWLRARPCPIPPRSPIATPWREVRHARAVSGFGA